jgi:hypothetical protein
MLAQSYATQMRAQAVQEKDKKKAELIAQQASEVSAGLGLALREVSFCHTAEVPV